MRGTVIDDEARSVDRGLNERNLQIMLENMDPSGNTRATAGLYVRALHNPVSIMDTSLRLQCGGCIGGRMEMGDKSRKWCKDPWRERGDLGLWRVMFSTKAILTFGEHLATSGDISGCHNLRGWRGGAYYWLLVGTD